MRPRLFAVAAVCCCLPVTVGAQIPKIKTPKVNVPGQNKEEQTAPAKPKCDISTVVISNEVVTRYLKALDARDAEIRSIAKENSAMGRYYAAMFKQQDEKRRWNDFQAGVGPDYVREQEAFKKAKTDVNAYKTVVEIEQSVRPSDTKLPETSFEDQKTANDRIDAAMRKAGNFEDCDWAGVNDVVPAVTYAISENPNLKPADVHVGRSTGVSADELAAVRAKRMDLAKGLGIAYKSDSVATAEKSGRATKRIEVGTDPMAAYNLCTQIETKSSLDYIAQHQAEIDAAQKTGDYQKVAEISAKANEGMVVANTKCQPLMPH
jgi:hypothetical protein